jgi:hypothetical protein
MAVPAPAFESLSSADLLADERKLYLDCASPSMFAFCVHELGFSEDAAYNRITVARAGRRLPAVLESVRLGQVHLAGLRLLSPHLTSENHRDVLAQAAGRSKREIEELVARLAPQPPVAAVVRKLSERPGLALPGSPPDREGHRAHRSEARPLITPLSEETYKILDGFARTHLHEAARIRLLCRAHNQHAAEQMYGRSLMEQARARRPEHPRPP